MENKFTDEESRWVHSMPAETSVKSSPNEIKQRQVAYMTAAVMWFILFCIMVIVGSFVWKVCIDIASS